MARKKDVQATNYLNRVSNRLVQAATDMKLTQADVIKKCKDKGFTITKSTLSKIWTGTGGRTLYNIANIAEALDLNMNELCSISSGETINIPNSSEETIITRGKYFEKYIGEYHVIMYRTLSDEIGFMKGKLIIDKQADSSDLGVIIENKTNPNYIDNDENKRYEGTVKYSPQMHVLYISAINNEIGEEVYIIFPYIHLTRTELYCRIGLCLTSCAGTTRIPTAQRIIISRGEIPDDLLNIVHGQLLLNDSKIRISSEQFKKLKNSAELPDSFKEMFIENDELMGAIKRTYYIINEATIRSSEMSLEDKIKSICVLRNYSEAPKHTKVSDKANEFLYKILQNKNRND